MQTIQVHHWDDPAHRQGQWVPAKATVTVTVQVVPIGDDGEVPAQTVTGDLELSADSLAELLGEKALGPWLEMAGTPARAGRRSGASAPAHHRNRDIRAFADALGRSEEYINPGWTEGDGTRNKYSYGKQLVADFGAWDEVGRPPLEDWQPPAAPARELLDHGAMP